MSATKECTLTTGEYCCERSITDEVTKDSSEAECRALGEQLGFNAIWSWEEDDDVVLCYFIPQ